jgi:hypothetical protein
MEMLSYLGIGDGISEIIATTERDGRFNAAPIGITRNKDNAFLRLFIGTHTFENILESGCFVANVSHDAMIFVDSAMSELPQECFERRDGVLTLKDAESWILFKVEESFRTDIIMPRIEPVKGELLHPLYRAFNRGVSLVIEAAIAGTRYNALHQESYLDEIRQLGRIISRCGGQRELEAFKKLEEYIYDRP